MAIGPRKNGCVDEMDPPGSQSGCHKKCVVVDVLSRHSFESSRGEGELRASPPGRRIVSQFYVSCIGLASMGQKNWGVVFRLSSKPLTLRSRTVASGVVLSLANTGGQLFVPRNVVFKVKH